jgi:hypothetical protein
MLLELSPPTGTSGIASPNSQYDVHHYPENAPQSQIDRTDGEYESRTGEPRVKWYDLSVSGLVHQTGYAITEKFKLNSLTLRRQISNA